MPRRIITLISHNISASIFFLVWWVFVTYVAMVCLHANLFEKRILTTYGASVLTNAGFTWDPLLAHRVRSLIFCSGVVLYDWRTS